MKNKYIGYFAFLFLGLSTISCSVESLSSAGMFGEQQPSALISSSFISNKAAEAETTLQQTKYMASLTNTLNEIPIFRYRPLNHEIERLKESVKSYIYAIRMNNLKDRDRAYKDYVDSFKKLQQLKKKLKPDDAQLLTVYLTRIKANVNSLQYIS